MDIKVSVGPRGTTLEFGTRVVAMSAFSGTATVLREHLGEGEHQVDLDTAHPDVAAAIRQWV